MFCDVNFMYGLYNDCARTLKRSLAGKLAIVKLSSGFGFARNSSKAPCALASFSRVRIPRSACTRDVTCELYCIKTDTIVHSRYNSSSYFVYTILNTFLMKCCSFELIALVPPHCLQRLHCQLVTKRQKSQVLHDILTWLISTSTISTVAAW